MKIFLRGTEGKYRVEKATKNIFPDKVYEVSPLINENDYPYLTVEYVYDGLGHMTEVVNVDEALKAAGDSVKNKKNQGKHLKKQYIEDVGAELQSSYGTTDQSKAIFLYLTYARMVDHPEEFSDRGLYDDKGKALDSDSKIYDYATVKIMRAVDYSVFVLNKMKKLKDDLSSL